MKIAILGSRHILSDYSGIERILRSYLPYLVERGHEVTVFGGPPPPGAGREGELWNGIRSVAVGGLRGKHSETLVRTGLSTAMALRGGFDVLHFTHQGPGVFCPLARLAGAATIVSVQGLDWQRAKWGRLASGAIRGAERMAVRAADGMVVSSRRIQRYFADTYTRETFYIPGGIELEVAPASTKFLDQHGLWSGGYLLFAARLVREKACHELIEAWNGVRTDKKLVVAGGGRYDEDYVRSLQAMAHPDKVIFTGHVKGAALRQLFGHAYAFVLPSHLEGQSTALLEALGYGRAVLVSDIPENLEAIEAGGFTFRVGDVAHLRERLAWLVDHPDAIRDMERQVGRAVGEWPGWKDVALLFEDVYAAAVRAKSSRATTHIGRLALEGGGRVKPRRRS